MEVALQGLQVHCCSLHWWLWVGGWQSEPLYGDQHGSFGWVWYGFLLRSYTPKESWLRVARLPNMAR